MFHLRHLIGGAALLIVGTACGHKEQIPPPPTPVVQADPLPPEKDLSHSSGLIIVSTPSTTVKVNGKPAGKTPVTVEDLAAGSYDITFADEVAGDTTMTVELSEGQYERVHYNLTPKAGAARFPD